MWIEAPLRGASEWAGLFPALVPFKLDVASDLCLKAIEAIATVAVAASFHCP